MKKRVLQIRVIKDPAPNVLSLPEPNEVRYDVTIDKVSHAVKSVIKTVGMVAVGHVALDTLRQVLVAKATKP